MNSNYKGLSQLQIIENLLAPKLKSKAVEQIKKVTYDELKKPNGVQKAFNSIHKNCQLKPVKFENIVLHSNSFRDNKDVITVRLPFTGSVELFEYRCNVESTQLSSEHGVVIPASNYCELSYIVDSLEGAKEKVLAMADKDFAMTIKYVNANSKYLSEISPEIDEFIADSLKKHEADLKALYS